MSPSDPDKHQTLKQDIELGLQQLRDGNYSTYTTETLPTLLDTIKQHGKQRIATDPESLGYSRKFLDEVVGSWQGEGIERPPQLPWEDEAELHW